MLRPGCTFAAYEVLRRLAVGGMGEIYLCRHRLLDRLDAVKVAFWRPFWTMSG